MALLADNSATKMNREPAREKTSHVAEPKAMRALNPPIIFGLTLLHPQAEHDANEDSQDDDVGERLNATGHVDQSAAYQTI
ncbi:MAG: hypothetical protein Q9203_003635 [Teloschistes exilis]